MLRTEQLSVTFGGIKALHAVSIAVKKGEILSIIGPNGAGKTTFFNAVTGFYRPASGSVYFNGQNATGLRSCDMARLGVARSFQNLGLFPEMSVIENVLVGREIHLRTGLVPVLFRTRAFHAEEALSLERTMEIIDFVGLSSRSSSLACNLTYGERKMLEIARALAMEPVLLMLDEPAAGMNSAETGFVMELIRKIRDNGITVVLIEHDMKLVMGLSERIYVLDYGELIAEGTPEDIRNNRKVIEAYLGSGALA